MSDEDDSTEDPLEKIVENKDAINRERLANAIDGIVHVDENSGEAIIRDGYSELGNEEKFVARLLARRAAVELEYIDSDDIGASSSEFAERMDPTESTIQNYGSLDFVDNDGERGGYYIPNHSVGLAINYLNEANPNADS